jgi:hypothetical protein
MGPKKIHKKRPQKKDPPGSFQGIFKLWPYAVVLTQLFLRELILQGKPDTSRQPTPYMPHTTWHPGACKAKKQKLSKKCTLGEN